MASDRDHLGSIYKQKKIGQLAAAIVMEHRERAQWRSKNSQDLNVIPTTKLALMLDPGKLTTVILIRFEQVSFWEGI
jgi:hypothetical protein